MYGLYLPHSFSLADFPPCLHLSNLLSRPSLFFFPSVAPHLQSYKQSAKHKQILAQFFFPNIGGLHLTRNTYFFTFHSYHMFIWVHKEVCTPRRYKVFSPFIQGQEVMARLFFFVVLSPKYGSLHRKVTLGVNSV